MTSYILHIQVFGFKKLFVPPKISFLTFINFSIFLNSYIWFNIMVPFLGQMPVLANWQHIYLLDFSVQRDVAMLKIAKQFFCFKKLYNVTNFRLTRKQEFSPKLGVVIFQQILVVSKHHNKSGKHVNINFGDLSKCKHALKVIIYTFTTLLPYFETNSFQQIKVH